MNDNLENQTVTLTGADSSEYTCRILGIFEFEDKEYALLRKIGEDNVASGEDETTVIMLVVRRDDRVVFRSIENDEEFERILAYIRELSAEMEG